MSCIGHQLESSFSAASSGIRGEIDLFRALIKALVGLQGAAVAEEYHGAKSHVVFSAKRGAGRRYPRCELADLLLLTFRRGRGNAASARMTWMQAKVSSSPLSLCHVKSVPNQSRIAFGANLEQWDLLAHRPGIRGATSRFQPPTDLLSAAVLPSIGSFGVFYQQGSKFNMAYFVGDYLVPLNNHASRSGTLIFKHSSSIRKIGCFREATVTCCLYYFGMAIESGMVGSPVLSLLSTGRGPARTARRAWVRSLLRGLAEDRPESELVRELTGLLGLDLGDAGESPVPTPIPARFVVLLGYGNEERAPG